MNSMLIIASLIAVTVATPTYRNYIAPGTNGPAAAGDYVSISGGPAPVEGPVPIATGPGFIEESPVPIGTGPAVIEGLVPIGTGPAVIEGFEPVPIGTGPAVIEGLVPIGTGPAVIEGFEVEPTDNVLTIPDSNGSPLIQIIVKINRESAPAEVVPAPVNFVDQAESVPVVVPVEIGTPVMPEPVPIPVVTAPEVLN